MNFREFEHVGWEQLPRHYHEGFARLTTQVIPALLDAAGVGRGTRLLDVATGPGYVATAAAQRGAAVLGVDFASAMVAEARRRCPGLQFEEGDAEALAFRDASFDAVTINFGVLHLARRIGRCSKRIACCGREAGSHSPSGPRPTWRAASAW